MEERQFVEQAYDYDYEDLGYFSYEGLDLAVVSAKYNRIITAEDAIQLTII